MRSLNDKEEEYCIQYIQNKANDWNYCTENSKYLNSEGARIILVAYIQQCEQSGQHTRIKTLDGLCERAIQSYWDKYRGQMYELFTLTERPTVNIIPIPEKQPEPKPEPAPEQPKQTVPTGQPESNSQIDPFVAYVESRIGQNIEKSVMEHIEPVIEKAVKNAEPKEIIVKTATQTNVITDVTHAIFPKVLEYADKREPIYIYGPAGSGKNVLGMQVAKALGLDYYYVGRCETMFQFTGFTDAGGKFHPTEFYRAFKNGGLLFIDEMDSSVPEVLNSINVALANRMFVFDDGGEGEKVYAHPNFTVIAQGNTIGNGADEIYTGRNQLDQATMNRFGKEKMDYDVRIERAICNNNEELIDFIHAYRDAVKSISTVQPPVSYREIKRIATFENDSNVGFVDAVRIGLTEGTDKADLTTICNFVVGKIGTTNKYVGAVKKILEGME